MDRYDGLLLAGIVLVEGGVAMVSVPAALILGGAFLIVGAYVLDTTRRRRALKEEGHGTPR